MIILKSDVEIGYMKEAGKVTDKAHQAMKKFIKPGVSTLELDEIVKDIILSGNCKPAFLNYYGYPKHICASINEEVVHGIPKEDRVLKDGDIVSIDIGAFYKGYCSDQAKTYPVGEISKEAKKLIDVTKESFYKSLEVVKEGFRVYNIGKVIEEYVLSNNMNVVKDYTGHGVGKDMHEDPSIPNYLTGIKGPRLLSGMTLAIEPMVNIGKSEVVVLEDGWTVVTMDKSLSAHYEHTVLVTKGEAVIISQL